MSHVTVSNCTTGDVRLVNGSTQYEGRVEICMNEVWGSVCDNSWDSSSYASVICKQLGYQGKFSTFIHCSVFVFYVFVIYLGGIPLSHSHFGPGNGPIHIYYTNCYKRTNLLSCQLTRVPYIYYRRYCNNYREAGVRCECEWKHKLSSFYLFNFTFSSLY